MAALPARSENQVAGCEPRRSRRGRALVVAVGLWGLAIAASSQVAIAAAPTPADARPDVILITIDTLRADRLGAYGYQPATTPHLDAFAERAILYEQAFSQAPNTIPSLLQLMTSRYGMSDMVRHDQTTLAQLLKEEGYVSIAIVDNPLNSGLATKTTLTALYIPSFQSSASQEARTQSGGSSPLRSRN